MNTRYALLPLLFATAACGAKLYELPPPSAESEWTTFSMDPSAEDDANSERFQEARRAVLRLYEAIGTEDWAAAYEMLSYDTRILLDALTDGQGELALAAGEITVDDRVRRFDPVVLLLNADPLEIVDELPDVTDPETSRREVVHIVSDSAPSRAVTVILEADAWRIHMPAIPEDRLSGGAS